MPVTSTPANATRLAVFRILVGAYATGWSLLRFPEHLGQIDRPGNRWHPVGVLSWLDGAPADAVIVAVAIAAPLLSLAFMVGWRFRAVGPVTAVVLLVVMTLDSSWGQVFHTENLVVLHAAVLAASPAADALVPGRARRAERIVRRRTADDYGWALSLAAAIVAITYVLAGIAKLRIAGWSWLDGDVLRHLVAHDNLRKAVLGDTHSPIGTALVAHRWVFTPMAIASVLVELAAPLALLGGRLRTAWVTAAWTFHVGVLVLMAVLFAYPLVGVAFAPFFALERLVPRRFAPVRSDGEDAVHQQVDAADDGERGHRPGDRRSDSRS